MTPGELPPEEQAVFDAFRAHSAQRYAQVLDTEDGMSRVYGAAMCALAYCASDEGFPRFRRWLSERPAVHGMPDDPVFAPGSWNAEALGVAARVLAGWTILHHDGQEGEQPQ